MGFSRWSLRVSSLISNLSKGLRISHSPERGCSAPEQKERNTNITVQGEKRSVQLAQIVRFDKRMFIGEERRDDRDSGPRGPGKREAGSEPYKQSDDTDMHDASDPK